MDDEDMDDEDMDDEDMDDEDMDDKEFDEKLKEHKEWLKTVKCDDSFFFEAEDQDNIDEDDEDDEVHPEQKSVLKKKIKKVYDKLKNKNWKIPEDNDFKLIFQNKKELTKELIGLSIFTLKEILAYFNSQNDEKNQEAKKARAVARANKPKRVLTSDELKKAREAADTKRKLNSLKNKIRKDYDKLKKVRYVFPLNPLDSYFGQPGFNFDTKEDLNAYLRGEKNLIKINNLHKYLSSHLDHWNSFSPWGGHANKNLHQSGFVIGAGNSDDKSGRMTDHDKLYQSYKWAIGGKPIVPFDKTNDAHKARHDAEIAKIFSPDVDEPEKVNDKRRLRTIYNIRREDLEEARGRSFNYIELEKLKNTYEIEDKLTYLLELYNDHMKETNQDTYDHDEWHNPPAETIRLYSRSGGASSGRVQNFGPNKGKNQSTDTTANKYRDKIAALERTIKKCYNCNEKHYKIDMLTVRPDGQPARYICPSCQKVNKEMGLPNSATGLPFNTRPKDGVSITHENPIMTNTNTNTKPMTNKTKTSLTNKIDKLFNQTTEEVNWWNSIHSMLGHDSNEKHSDGLTNLPEVIKPSAGQVGFAPQGRIGWFQ